MEYNGKQHYGPNIYLSKTKEKAEKKFVEQQIRDEWLREYCKTNNIKLIEIDGRKYTNDKIYYYLLPFFEESSLDNSNLISEAT